MRYITHVALLVALLILVGCKTKLGAGSAGEYWITGLSLPSGSTVLSKAEETNQESITQLFSTREFSSQPDKALSVTFNCPAGWDAVSAHVTSCLIRHGYSLEALDLKLKNVGGRLGEALNSFRDYSKPGGEYYVILFNMASASSQSAENSFPPEMGDFWLIILHLK